MKTRLSLRAIYTLVVIVVVTIVIIVIGEGMIGGKKSIYYVDFDKGSDNNAGNSKTKAWKHAPGDPAATLTPLNIVLKPGDEVRFKGGVTYRGNIRINSSGNAAGDITYSGRAWGTKQAIISGAEPLNVRWTKCTSADQVNGNPNYTKIYYAQLPTKQNFFATLYQGNNMYYFSQYPQQPDPFSFNDTDYFISRNLPDARYEVTSTSIRDDVYFVQPDGYWNNSYISIWVYPNICVNRRVTSYNSATHTITFDAITNNTFYDDVLKYSMLNNTALIDGVGKYSYDESTNTVYLWAYDPTFETPITVAKRDRAFNINGKSYISIKGFKISEFIGLPDGHHQGVAVFSLNTEVKNITIKENTIYNMRSMEGAAVIDFTYGDNIQILNNEVTNIQKGSAISAVLQNSKISGNIIDKVGRTGIRLLGTAAYPSLKVQIVGNKIKNIYDIHGNGISLYNNNINCLVADNIVTDASRPMTIQGYNTPATVHNIIIYNNLLISKGVNAVAALTDWGNKLNNVKILNNILLSPGSAALALHHEAVNVTVKNNIIEAFAITGIGINNAATDCRSLPAKGWEFSHNIYSAFSWMQNNKAYNWTPGEGEIKSMEELLFKDSAIEDYTHAKASPAIDAGVEVTELIGNEFAGFNPLYDLLGKKRTKRKWDIGCYEK